MQKKNKKLFKSIWLEFDWTQISKWIELRYPYLDTNHCIHRFVFSSVLLLKYSLRYVYLYNLCLHTNSIKYINVNHEKEETNRNERKGQGIAQGYLSEGKWERTNAKWRGDIKDRPTHTIPFAGLFLYFPSWRVFNMFIINIYQCKSVLVVCSSTISTYRPPSV